MNYNKALIFIPDISGFTEFVKDVEIDHSQHIIKELLEVIIDQNHSGMKISEIEGDAILFYKLGDPVQIDEVIRQCKEMFLAFHQHLKLYSENLICGCGACSSHQSLSLKFVVHYGEVKEVSIKNFNKLHGEDLILAHRLLKNSISSAEYILFSDMYFSNQNSSHNLVDGTTKYGDFGIVSYKYLLLEKWMEDVPEPLVSRTPIPKYNNPIEVDIEINAPLDIVYQKFIDNTLKEQWVPGIKKIEASNQELPLKGSSHMCIFPGFEIDIELLDGEIGENNSIIIEHSKGVPIVGESYTIFKMTPINDGTRLSMEVRMPGENIFQRLKKRLVFNKFKKNFAQSIRSFKKYVEDNSQTQEITNHNN